MTIAACYLSSEGVVLGADSTSTVFVPSAGGQPPRPHYFDFAQKVFEFGEIGSTIGVTFWGLGSLGDVSYRTLIAEAADEVAKGTLVGPDEVARLLSRMFWAQYSSYFGAPLGRARDLARKGKGLSEEQNKELEFWLQHLSGGFCVGGRQGGRRSAAYEVLFDPTLSYPPDPSPLQPGNAKFWGCPNLIYRLLFGIDLAAFDAIVRSGKWGGTPAELVEIIRQGTLSQPADLPLREAIDWVYASI